LQHQNHGIVQRGTETNVDGHVTTNI